MINLILLLQNLPVSMQVNHKTVNHPFIAIQVRSITMNHYTYNSNWKIVDSWSDMNKIIPKETIICTVRQSFLRLLNISKMQIIVGASLRICSWNSTWVYVTKIQKKRKQTFSSKAWLYMLQKKIIENDLNLGPAPMRVVARDNIMRFKPGSPSFKLH